MSCLASRHLFCPSLSTIVDPDHHGFTQDDRKFRERTPPRSQSEMLHPAFYIMRLAPPLTRSQESRRELAWTVTGLSSSVILFNKWVLASQIRFPAVLDKDMAATGTPQVLAPFSLPRWTRGHKIPMTPN
ncbi:uncharacterized protein ATNIH1004_001954 [Aspergillus tanneri]|uniref:Uncharacterized protein n=1 Tax=Aspergillus tanneri TaxID=1220188 RepID=A0A5M9MAB6_9EURO|nr:uncharacterized protein ATNIH1004_001954 [Aspergillus tanneri]KAA8641489.1 hypothetical protein ATNIH1004_001954 [Aspergillus tanneri]